MRRFSTLLHDRYARRLWTSLLAVSGVWFFVAAENEDGLGGYIQNTDIPPPHLLIDEHAERINGTNFTFSPPLKISTVDTSSQWGMNYGMFIDVTASEGATIRITSLDVMTEHPKDEKDTELVMYVITKSGSYEGHEASVFDYDPNHANSWQMIVNTKRLGRGITLLEEPLLTLTKIPADVFATPVIIPPGTTRTFCIMINRKELVYHINDGEASVGNHDISIGGAKVFDPTSTEDGIILDHSVIAGFNGVVHYEVLRPPELHKSPTHAPTLQPTQLNVKSFESEEGLLLEYPVTRKLSTSLKSADMRSYGNCFTTRVVNSAPILMQSLQLLLDDVVPDKQAIVQSLLSSRNNELESTTVEVWTKLGRYDGFERLPSSWKLVAMADAIPSDDADDGTVTRNGPRLSMPIVLSEPVWMNVKEDRSWYITLHSNRLRYTDLDGLQDDIWAKNDHLQVMVGTSMGWPAFDEIFLGRRGINAVFHYRLQEGSPTASPTSGSVGVGDDVERASTFREPVQSQQVISIYSRLGRQGGRMRRARTRSAKSSDGMEKVVDYDSIDPYILWFVEESVRESLEPYLQLHDPPIALSRVKVEEAIPDDLEVAARMLGVASDQEHDRFDFYTTIDGEFTPPPANVHFDEIVEQYFDLDGDVFLRNLQEEEFFDEAVKVTLTPVDFSLGPDLRTVSDPRPKQRKYSKAAINLIIVSVLVAAIGIAIGTLVTGRKRRETNSEEEGEIAEATAIVVTPSTRSMSSGQLGTGSRTSTPPSRGDGRDLPVRQISRTRTRSRFHIHAPTRRASLLAASSQHHSSHNMSRRWSSAQE